MVRVDLKMNWMSLTSPFIRRSSSWVKIIKEKHFLSVVIWCIVIIVELCYVCCHLDCQARINYILSISKVFWHEMLAVAIGDLTFSWMYKCTVMYAFRGEFYISLIPFILMVKSCIQDIEGNIINEIGVTEVHYCFH